MRVQRASTLTDMLKNLLTRTAFMSRVYPRRERTRYADPRSVPVSRRSAKPRTRARGVDGRRLHSRRSMSRACPRSLEHLVERSRKEVLAAVQQDGRALQFASFELKQDREVVLAAVRQNGWAFEFASSELRQDREVVLAAAQRSPFALKFASSELQQDREVVLAAMQRHGRALQFASKELRRDREVVRAAMQQSPYALDLMHKSAFLTTILTAWRRQASFSATARRDAASTEASPRSRKAPSPTSITMHESAADESATLPHEHLGTQIKSRTHQRSKKRKKRRGGERRGGRMRRQAPSSGCE